MQPDCRDIKPVYEQITDGIRKMIITHAIPEGEKLPSVRELASKFAVNPNAVRNAYQELEEEGYVCDREGERMAASEKQIAELIRKELNRRYYMPVIKEILKVVDRFGFSYWTVKTSGGPLEFSVRDPYKSILHLGNRLIITDADGNRYEIPDVTALKKSDLRKIELYLY